jgi:hypothetical protein
MNNNTDNLSSSQRNKQNTGEDENSEKRKDVEKTNPQDELSNPAENSENKKPEE